MGLSRNKVAVGEPAAGSPPFEGESIPVKIWIFRCIRIRGFTLVVQIGPIAQLAERSVDNGEVSRSSRLRPTSKMVLSVYRGM